MIKPSLVTNMVIFTLGMVVGISVFKTQSIKTHCERMVRNDCSEMVPTPPEVNKGVGRNGGPSIPPTTPKPKSLWEHLSAKHFD